MGNQSALRVFDIQRDDGGDGTNQSLEPVSMFHPIGSKPTVCAFAHTSGLIVTGHESGKVALFDAKTGEEVNNNERAHMDTVTDLQLSPDRSYFITSSKDKTARVCICLCDVPFMDTEIFLGIDLYSYTTQGPYEYLRRTRPKHPSTVPLSLL